KCTDITAGKPNHMKKKTIGITIIAVCLGIITLAQSVHPTYKFDFGTGQAAKGYIPVTPATKFNWQTGYGFDKGSTVEAIDRGGKHAVTSDYITSHQPFYFSV